MNKKCIVVDLDNTLWGGVVGEDGWRGVALGVTPPGAYFVAFQQALLDLWNRGVILAINSANNSADALEVIEKNPNMILKSQHFAAQRINWDDKVENMKSLATELNIGLDSMVFFDDSPQNREAMRGLLPEIETPELPIDPSRYVQFLHSLTYFEGGIATNEDTMRGNMYVTERLRKELEKTFQNKIDFLKSLGLTLEISENDTSVLPRISQLSEKTNQFNTNKCPMGEKELSALIEGGTSSVYHGRVTDKFGDYGITAVAIVRKYSSEWIIESLFMSCRILGRGIEEAFAGAIAKSAARAGVSALVAKYVETPKNIPARDFLRKYFPSGSIDPVSFPKSMWVKYI